MSLVLESRLDVILDPKSSHVCLPVSRLTQVAEYSIDRGDSSRIVTELINADIADRYAEERQHAGGGNVKPSSLPVERFITTFFHRLANDARLAFEYVDLISSTELMWTVKTRCVWSALALFGVRQLFTESCELLEQFFEDPSNHSSPSTL
nr:hypothetical protein Iba_chr06aCG5290 [Ipomoea batatas]